MDFKTAKGFFMAELLEELDMLVNRNIICEYNFPSNSSKFFDMQFNTLFRNTYMVNLSIHLDNGNKTVYFDKYKDKEILSLEDVSPKEISEFVRLFIKEVTKMALLQKFYSFKNSLSSIGTYINNNSFENYLRPDEIKSFNDELINLRNKINNYLNTNNYYLQNFNIKDLINSEQQECPRLG